MRFMSIYRSAESSTPPCPEDMQAMGALIEKSTREGTLISTGGCLPSALGARVRVAKGRVTVVDGPFTETKEVVGGFAILEARDKAHAIELAREFLAVVGDEGECEVRQMFVA